ncbi:MAG: membrane protein insertion efficiency factor YidD [Longimicrobiales bacterium]
MLSRFLIGAIKLYQRAISPLLPPACRFEPTCSHYALQAIRAHGVESGGWLALRRLGRCHPWGGSGYDPVPVIELNAAASALPLKE